MKRSLVAITTLDYRRRRWLSRTVAIGVAVAIVLAVAVANSTGGLVGLAATAWAVFFARRAVGESGLTYPPNGEEQT
jgi:hypothetical protein